MNAKKTAAIILVAVMVLGMLATSVAAIDPGITRVTIGADLDAAQRAQIYKDFGIQESSATQLIVTNAEERAYLEGLVPEEKIGSVALSCVCITTLEAGSGLQISTNNINWCTSEMYVNALTTAGITDARVKVSAPFPVSGTAALTGIYKAYENITGIQLSELAKAVGAEELVLTGQLAEYIGSEEATEVINELKKILDQTKNMTDEQVTAEIKSIATQYNVLLTDSQVAQVLKLCRQLEKLDTDELKAKLLSLTETVQKAGKVQQTFTKIGESVKTFFTTLTTFFYNLFGKK